MSESISSGKEGYLGQVLEIDIRAPGADKE